MFKAVCLSTLTLLSCSGVLEAWGGGRRAPMEKEQPPIDVHFPFNSEQAWGLEESLLVWKTYEDDGDYALYTKSDTSVSNIQSNTYKIKHPNFDWNAGVRVKLTRYLPSTDPWDVNLIGTYYYAQGESNPSVSSSSSTQVTSTIYGTWATEDGGSAQKVKAQTHMNFFTFDLTAGRSYCLTRKINIHPFIGIRSVLNYQKYKTTQTLQNTTLPVLKPAFEGSHDFWGLGPRVGSDLVMQFGRHWSFLATFAGSLFAGRYNIDEKMNGNFFNSSTYTSSDWNIKDGDTVLRSNIDLALGLGWEKWVRGQTVRIAPSFVFEVSEWFSMKRWIDMRRSGTTPQVQTHRRYSNLGLMGFNVNLQVDF